ncbi:unnamed protein product [Closterium sp. Naga37s-1]|nr:unnamed protein product [Closterium sp. Naga37s-1]
MAIALKQGLKKMQKNAPSELLPAVTILVPTNRALLAASLNPAFLIDLIQNKKKVQGIAKSPPIGRIFGRNTSWHSAPSHPATNYRVKLGE